MKIHLGLVLGISCVLTVFAGEPGNLITEADKVSYSMGVDFGKNLASQGYQVNREALIKGIEDGLRGGETLLSDNERKQVLLAFSSRVRQEGLASRKAKADKNRIEALGFLEQNRKEPGIITLPSGLQYRIIKEGTGHKPKPNDRVTVHYEGSLTDGSVFDSSYRRNKPNSYIVRETMPGWAETLLLMPLGSKWKIFVPPDLGYGNRIPASNIPENAALIYELELLEIQEANL